MTRRAFLSASILAAAQPSPIHVPVRIISNRHAHCDPERLRIFWWRIWPDALRMFASGGIRIDFTHQEGEVQHYPGGRPLIKGLAPGVVNIVVTDSIPLLWDGGRGLAGITTQYDGYHLSMISVAHAHGNAVPFISVNTVVHELLHVLLMDVYQRNGSSLSSAGRELRIDVVGTRLWLFHDGAEIRRSAAVYLERLKKQVRTAG
jgi:hypothetical protein